MNTNYFGLSLAGGAISLFLGFTIPWLFPEFYLFGELFVLSFQIILSIGGCITILGAILYAKDINSSNILLLIGSLVGGLNIISIWGWRKIHDERTQRKKNLKLNIKHKNLFKIEKRILAYLEENKGKAFTAGALHKRCIEENSINISVTEIDKILNDLHSLGKVRSSVNENVDHYFVKI